MQLETAFDVTASPERVFAYVVDVRRMVACVPGAELSEVVGPDTFKGTMAVRVGPIKPAYDGTLRIIKQDDLDHTLTFEAVGTEAGGSGSASMTASLMVLAGGAGSVVKVATDYTVRGRVAQFGRGLIEDVFRDVLDEMGRRLKAAVEAEESSEASAPAHTVTRRTDEVKPLNAMALILRVLWRRVKGVLRRLFAKRSRDVSSGKE